MNSRRRISIVLLIAASVFLCILASCGIPTPINASVSFTSDSITTNPYIEFSVTYTGDAVGTYGKVGLLILYFPDTGVVDSQDSTRITSKFSSNYKVSNGVVVDVTNDNRVFEISTSHTDSGIGYVYAFELDGTAVEHPTYTYGLSTSGDFTSLIKLEYVEIENIGKIKMTVDGVEQATYLTFDDDVNVSVTKYLNIYAAVSVQSSQYSNLFWSDLKSVGTIYIN